MYWISHVSVGVSNSFFNTFAVLECMDDMFFNSRSVKLNFAYSCSVTVNVKQIKTQYLKVLQFQSAWMMCSLILDVSRLLHFNSGFKP